MPRRGRRSVPCRGCTTWATGPDGQTRVLFAHSLGATDSGYGEGTGGTIGVLEVRDDAPVYLYDARLPGEAALHFPRDLPGFALHRRSGLGRQQREHGIGAKRERSHHDGNVTAHLAVDVCGSEDSDDVAHDALITRHGHVAADAHDVALFFRLALDRR